jgi:hypothetical protein
MKINLQDQQLCLVILELDLQVKDFYLLRYQPFVEHPDMYQPRWRKNICFVIKIILTTILRRFIFETSFIPMKIFFVIARYCLK